MPVANITDTNCGVGTKINFKITDQGQQDSATTINTTKTTTIRMLSLKGDIVSLQGLIKWPTTAHAWDMFECKRENPIKDAPAHPTLWILKHLFWSHPAMLVERPTW